MNKLLRTRSNYFFDYVENLSGDKATRYKIYPTVFDKPDFSKMSSELIQAILGKEFGGELIGVEIGAFQNVSKLRDFANAILEKSPVEIRERIDEALISYAISALSDGYTVYEFADRFGIDLRYAYWIYVRARTEKTISKRSMTWFRGYEFPTTHAKHTVIYGVTRAGKSTTLARIAYVLTKSGWSVIDLFDTGRLESVAWAFSLDDEELYRVLKRDWERVGIDDIKTRDRILSDIEAVRDAVEKYIPSEIGGHQRVKIYHPLFADTSLPETLPTIRGRVEFVFYKIPFTAFFSSVAGNFINVLTRIFSITIPERNYLEYALNYLENEKDITVLTIGDLINLLEKWIEADKIKLVVGGEEKTISVTKSTVVSLLRKLSQIASREMFAPENIIVEGEKVKNPFVLDIDGIVNERGIIHVMSYKWIRKEYAFLITTYILDYIMSAKRTSEMDKKVAILVRELAELAPSRGGHYLAGYSRHSLIEIFARGADLGVRVVADTQQILQLTREIKRNVHIVISHRIIDRRDKDELYASLKSADMYVDIRDDLSSLKVGEAIAIYLEARKIKIIPPPYFIKPEGLDILKLVKRYRGSEEIRVEDIYEKYSEIVKTTMTERATTEDKQISSVHYIPTTLAKIGVRTFNEDKAKATIMALVAIHVKSIMGFSQDIFSVEVDKSEILKYTEKYFPEFVDTLKSKFATLFDSNIFVRVGTTVKLSNRVRKAKIGPKAFVRTAITEISMYLSREEITEVID